MPDVVSSPATRSQPRESLIPNPVFLFVEPCVHAVIGQAGIESAHGITVRVGVAEEDFERAVVSSGHKVIDILVLVANRRYSLLNHRWSYLQAKYHQAILSLQNQYYAYCYLRHGRRHKEQNYMG